MLLLPISTRTVDNVHIAGVDYRLKIRGSNVIQITPGGQRYPLYNHYPIQADDNIGQPAMKTVKRFIQ